MPRNCSGCSLQVGIDRLLLSRDAKAAVAGLEAFLVLLDQPGAEGFNIRSGADCGADKDRR
jgi:hypothetical protein